MKIEIVFKNDGVAMSEILEDVLIGYQSVSILIHGRYFSWKKSIIFGRLASVARFIAQFYYTGTKNRLATFGRFYLKRQLNSSQVVDYSLAQKCWNKLTLLGKIEI